MTESGIEFGTESGNQRLLENESYLVSYSGIAEYLPRQQFASGVDPQDHAADCLTETIDASAWKSFASFQVELQSRRINYQTKHQTEQRLLARNLNTGTIEIWTGLKTDQLQQWIAEQTYTMLPIASVQINQVRILQSPKPGTVTTMGDRSLQTIRANQAFTLHIVSQFTGLPGELDGEAIGCQVHCCARHLSTGAIVELQDMSIEFHRTEMQDAADRVAFDRTARAKTYQAQLPKRILSEPGVYRLSIALSVTDLPDLSTLFKPSALQVV